MSDAVPGRPPMGRDEVDRTLGHLRDERERISSALLELEANQGYRMLEGAALSGETLDAQAVVRARMAALWALFDLYGGVLGAAEELRERHSRPGQAQLAELTRLLAGPSVELPVEEVPLERRTLLSAPTGEKLTLQATVARMTPLFEEVARRIAALDTVWSALLSRLAALDAERRTVSALLASLGGTEPEFDRIGGEIDALAGTVRSDPLALSRDGHADTARLDAAGDDLAGLRRRLEEAARLRDGFAGRVRAIAGTVELVRGTEAAARRVRAEVLVKISDPALPDPPDLSAALADRLAAVSASGGRGDLVDLADRVAGLERAAKAALEQARTALALIQGLLDRRDELRGRLEAYQVKAARLGHAEDDELARIHEEARMLLWSSPCDLRKATVTLSGYQQAISSRAKGPGR
ncbi:hypothetical protein [Spirillospora sp. NBC_01491]|uniref:hypothetical protein n=1 Tax=Spirillospora sp. NBC_01491 TaxID=2976007 RepID=UPI002E35F5BA|nr:hypothetical protein [Spirillospora sp. NBC_01491]